MDISDEMMAHLAKETSSSCLSHQLPRSEPHHSTGPFLGNDQPRSLHQDALSLEFLPRHLYKPSYHFHSLPKLPPLSIFIALSINSLLCPISGTVGTDSQHPDNVSIQKGSRAPIVTNVYQGSSLTTTSSSDGEEEAVVLMTNGSSTSNPRESMEEFNSELPSTLEYGPTRYFMATP
jgi:hypothetical protein